MWPTPNTISKAFAHLHSAAILAAFVMALSRQCIDAQEVPGATPNAKMPPIVCLRTEWLPTKKVEKGVLPEVLSRELGRQALLIAARDELGLATRDETLGEPFPQSITQQKQDLVIKVRGYKDGSTRIDFAPVSEPDEIGEDGDKQTKYSPLVISELADGFEAMSRGDLPQRLQGCGFGGKMPPPNEDNRPTDTIEGRLMEMNFVSQFEAVRAAHAAIAEKGQSRGWLGVLTRGYANLALMTAHHWKSDYQVFAARALLYGKRLAQANPKDPLSRAHLAYAEAVLGLHGAALADLDRIETLRKDAGDKTAVPGWYDLLRPYCSFEREPLIAMVSQRKSLRELAQRLSFEQTRGFGDDHWTLESAQQTIGVCPDEYGVYGAIGIPHSPLSVKRMGAYSAPAALAKFLPQRIAALSEAPEAVRDAAKGIVNKNAPANNQPTGDGGLPTLHGEYAAATTPIVAALRSATELDRDRGEPTWSVLGELIFEEQFVQAANYFAVAMDGTDSSHAIEVAQVMPAVKGHRYAKFIESFAVDARAERAKFNEIVGNFEIVDPRASMQPMMYRMWNVKNGKGNDDVGWSATEAAFRFCDLTYSQLLDAQLRLSTYWWPKVEGWQRDRRSDDFSAISPRSPQALRLAMAVVEKPTYEQARKWDSEAGDDPKSFAKLGDIYAALEYFDDAIRCFERSIELSPSKDAFVGLANAHRANRQDELWLPTLQRFFEIPALGLEHASVHDMIASEYMSKGKWDEAEPHSLEAAQTYSAWGLLSAADVFEGRQRLAESEKYIQAMSDNYSTSSGHQWYFWCLRNGSGDLEKSRAPAHTYFEARNPDDDQLRREQFLVYRVSKDDPKSAMKHAKFLFDKHNTKTAVMPTRAFYALQMAELALELKDDESKKTSLESARRTVNLMKEDKPDLSGIVQYTCRLLDDTPIAAAGGADIDKHLKSDSLNDSQRCGFEYLIGRAYELHGKGEEAADYYHRAVNRFRANREVATLAGIRLYAVKQGDRQAAAEVTK